MTWLDSLERLAEEMVEGSSRRVFRPRLEPVQVAKAAAKALDETQTIGPGGPQVANHYLVRLNAADVERFAPYQRTMLEWILNYLDEYTRDRGLTPIGAWRVQMQADASVAEGGVRVDARFADAAASTTASPPTDDAGHTRKWTAPDSRLARPRNCRAVLVLEPGERLSVDAERAAISLGRALENSIPIQDSRVSRFHAEIAFVENEFLVRDLDSTNGTLLANGRVTEAVLRDGDEISLGGFRLTFHYD